MQVAIKLFRVHLLESQEAAKVTVLSDHTLVTMLMLLKANSTGNEGMVFFEAPQRSPIARI